ncbi:MAG: ABC-F type ribosomal protection protein [Clostridiales bacterium]|nr:ABC-F type ribosomal protection protein [Clostridiales bacterium]
MLLLNGTNLHKSFSGETLFQNVSFNVYDKDKIGFVGVNGAGKSTLFKMITGEMDFDSGDLTKSREIKIGYLEQHPVSDSNQTVMGEILTAFSELTDIELQLDQIGIDLQMQNGDVNTLIARQAKLQERFLELDGTHYKSKIRSALMGLGFSEENFYAPLSNLSGGQKTRVALCKILLSNTNLLLLDEPTNHLDIDSVEWLENFLDNYNGAFIVISHDRFFLDRVTNKTFELENKKFRSYNGNYSEYITQREIERLSQQRDYDWTVREIHRLEEVVEQQRRWKHKKNKKTHTLDNTRKMIERLEASLVKPDKSPDSVRFRFKACQGGAKHVLKTEDLSMSFNENLLFKNVNIHIQKGEKVFLLGPNGCGKTTLLKILMGQQEPTFGKYRIGDNIHVGYYDQFKENLNRDNNVINEIWDEHHTLSQTEVRKALALFLFKDDDVFKDIKMLSGGELARVELTKLLLKDVNFLIMDEPTNHLDISSREALESALYDYDGTMLMVSHDRYFINKLADKILYLTPNGVVEFEGNYEDYLDGKEKIAELNKTDDIVEEKGIEYKERKKLIAEKRKLLNRYTKVEELIEASEKKIAELEKNYYDPQIASDYEKLSEISAQMNSLRLEVDKLMEEWESLQLQIDEEN